MPNPTVGFLMAFCATPVMAATCNAGYFLYNTDCSKCTSGWYCPGDDTAHRCPDDTTDWKQVLANLGHDVLWIEDARLMSWNAAGGPITSITQCVTGRDFTTIGGRAYMEQSYAGTDYHSSDKFLWYIANDGYYLAPYSWSSYRDWYANIKPCTNAPSHAHYTGPGTPDSPDGTIVDANDCPWECDAGYGRVGDECKPLCTAGVTQLHAGNVAVPLFNARHTSPTLAIGINNTVCYGNLDAGPGNGLNIRYNAQTYHTVQ